MLVPKDPSLLGKTFEVDIVATGKHFMKGEVVKDSQVCPVPRPLPLPPGHLSGVGLWKSRTNGEGIRKGNMDGGGSRRVDITVLLFAAAAVLTVVLLVRLLT